jgi:hypothetical protein
MPPLPAISRISSASKTSKPSHRLCSCRGSFSRPPSTLALVAPLLGGTGGRVLCLANIARVPGTCPNSFVVGVSGVLRQTPCGLPPGTTGITPGLGWMVRVPVRGYPVLGLTPTACPAVRRYGRTALMVAASTKDLEERDEIVQKLVYARADVNTQNDDGFAFPAVRRACAVAAGAPIVPRLRRPAGGRRCTMRRKTAAPNPPCGCSSAAPTRASRTTTGALCRPHRRSDGRTPNRPESAQANASRNSTI